MRRSRCSPARASTARGSPTSPRRPGSPTASSTTTSTPRTRSSTSSSRSGGRSCSRRSASADTELASPRDKLEAAAGFIIDSYRHDPDLMKVIIVEVTRAANSFGRTHLPEIQEAYDQIWKIVADAQARGRVPRRRHPRVRRDALLRGDRAAPDRLDLRGGAGLRQRLRRGEGPDGRDDLRRPRATHSRPAAPGSLKSMWEGLARTRRQDRVLHGTAKAANVVVGLIAVPVWIIGQLIGGPTPGRAEAPRA